MNYIAEYLAETEEFFFEFLTEKVDIISVLKLCGVMELQGVYESVYSPASLETLVLLHGSMEKNFTLDEITYLQCSCNDAIFCVCNETGHAVIFSEIDIHEKEKNLVASAITKIAIKAFGGNILLCFKYDHELAFATANREHNTRNDYLLSRWYSPFSIPMLLELCSNCNGDLDEIVFAIERATPDQHEQRDYDATRYDYEYILGLQYIAATYGVELSKEMDRYVNFFTTPTIPVDSTSEAQSINDMLKYIGIDENSSYNYLEKAIGAEVAGAQHMEYFEETEFEFEAIDRVTAIPPDILSDAEKMLRYLESEDKVNAT